MHTHTHTHTQRIDIDIYRRGSVGASALLKSGGEGVFYVYFLFFIFFLCIGKAAWALVHLEEVEKECFAALIGLAHDPSLRRC